ncbi:MAG: hypothetical protein PHY92_01505 [Alphaproteobacteria bacterium]|nr:hypothetical protein [Alphaproteobacteria bacterium]
MENFAGEAISRQTRHRSGKLIESRVFIIDNPEEYGFGKNVIQKNITVYQQSIMKSSFFNHPVFVGLPPYTTIQQTVTKDGDLKVVISRPGSDPQEFKATKGPDFTKSVLARKFGFPTPKP